ncbi:hypothetical protein [Streptosporangium jomthongense]|uniref:Pycsar effector protein domain-containing protein n=1 Tax=Streptosporangium jomthongense TaxID=1193683 RepID=A0ABV8F0N5_9ACTN
MRGPAGTADRAASRYGIMGDYDTNDLLVEISGEHAAAAADFIVTAARQHADHQRDEVLAATPGARPGQEEADLVEETSAAYTELARGDTKAGILIGFITGLLGVLVALVALAPMLAISARTGLVVAVGLLTTGAATAIYSMIRPALPPTGQGTGFIAYAACSGPMEVLTMLATDPKTRKAENVIRLSTVTYSKYRRLRLAVDLVLASLIVMVVSLLLGAL